MRTPWSLSNRPPGCGMSPSKRADRCLGLAVALVASVVPLHAQRHGRPDSAQNYAKSIAEPTLKIIVDGHVTKAQHKDFAAMDRTSTDLPGRKPGFIRSFTGVTLAQLVPATAGPGLGGATYEIHYGFFHRRVIRPAELEPGSDLVIADTVDHKTFDRTSLLWVAAKTHDGQPIALDKVTSVVVVTRGPQRINPHEDQ
jgi:hypothetical protein